MHLKISAELPHSLQVFGIVGIPQPTTMQVRAQLPDGRHQLTGAYLGDDLGQLFQGLEKFRTGGELKAL